MLVYFKSVFNWNEMGTGKNNLRKNTNFIKNLKKYKSLQLKILT